MLWENSLPKHFWVELVIIACYVQKRILIRPLIKRTPYELWRGRSPNSSTMSFSLGSNNTISKWGRGGGSTTCYTPSVSQVALETSLEKCGGRVRMEGYEG